MADTFAATGASRKRKLRLSTGAGRAQYPSLAAREIDPHRAKRSRWIASNTPALRNMLTRPRARLHQNTGTYQPHSIPPHRPPPPPHPAHRLPAPPWFEEVARARFRSSIARARDAPPLQKSGRGAAVLRLDGDRDLDILPCKAGASPRLWHEAGHRLYRNRARRLRGRHQCSGVGRRAGLRDVARPATTHRRNLDFYLTNSAQTVAQTTAMAFADVTRGRRYGSGWSTSAPSRRRCRRRSRSLRPRLSRLRIEIEREATASPAWRLLSPRITMRRPAVCC